VFFSKTAFFLLQNQKHLILAFTIFFKKITLLRLIRKWIAVRSNFAFFFCHHRSFHHATRWHCRQPPPTVGKLWSQAIPAAHGCHQPWVSYTGRGCRASFGGGQPFPLPAPLPDSATGRRMPEPNGTTACAVSQTRRVSPDPLGAHPRPRELMPSREEEEDGERKEKKELSLGRVNQKPQLLNQMVFRTPHNYFFKSHNPQ
jgi:hypothetical protein